jgi:NAD(P)-dependent dehydrogenase (short-subunit alcohol dehydrogenase family)
MGEAKLPINTVAVVTGGGSGIGAAIAKRLAGSGATAVVCGRTRDSLDRTVAAIKKAGGMALGLECDVTDLGSVEAASARIGKEFGRVDILVNNAGIGAFSQPLHKMEPADWDAVMNTNLRGVFYCMRAFVPPMIKAGGGHIINISSLAGKNPVANGAAYAASKWGLNGLSYSVAEELRGHNIRVSTVCPGSVDTDLSPHDGKNKSKMLRPDDIAHAVAMLVTQAPQSFVSELLIRPTQKP